MCSPHAIVKGPKFTIVWASTSTGERPALDFFAGLKPEEQAKILTLFQRLANQGPISNREKFKKLDPGLWEFKSFQLRFVGDFRSGQQFVVALGLRKKSDAHKKSDLQKAERILREHDLTEKDRGRNQ